MESEERRRQGLYADILVTVLQVPAGKEGGPGGLPNLLKSGKKEEDGGEKKENGDDEEELEREGEGFRGYAGQHGVGGGQDSQISLVYFATFAAPPSRFQGSRVLGWRRGKGLFC